MSIGPVRGSLRGRGRGLRVDEHIAAYLGAALLAVVVATILVTFVLLLVRKSPTSSAVGSLRPLAHGAGGGIESRPPIGNRATG